MDAARPIRADEKVMVAWRQYQETKDYQNSHKWAQIAEHTDGSLWAAFWAGWGLAVKCAADVHESIDPASDDERQKNIPGAGAMGAVIEYRDFIRKELMP
jgi:hypothetical protein